ncbi:MAG: hypothetical protein HC896_00640 [Bacteroidales bacterium]|nr:hypothetical protein [Bacteroidales bacterium]
MFAQIATPEAEEFTNFRLTNKKIGKDLIQLEFSVDRVLNDTTEWMLHTVRNIRNIHDWSRCIFPADDVKVSLGIKPLKRQIGPNTWEGFTYQYFYSSASHPIYKITDRSSWEIDGSAINNEIWMRNGSTDSIYKVTNSTDLYSTEWYLPGVANPNIFQFHPLQTHFQGFTFTASDKGHLITWPNKVAHVRTLIEKWRDSDKIAHLHEHCNDLMNDFSTVPMEVLWLPGKQDRVGTANIYNSIRELVHEELHTQIGMKRERISTYGVIEEWEEPDFNHYISNGAPMLLDAGVKTVFIANQCQNVMNVWGLSNMCCNVDFKIADIVGEDLFPSSVNWLKTMGEKSRCGEIQPCLPWLNCLCTNRENKKA